MAGVKDKEATIICRCNDVTLKEIEECIDQGYTDLESLRRKLRLGFGPCQGRTCIPLVKRILARKIGKRTSEIEDPIIRAPIIPIPIRLFIKKKENKK